jgi:exopolysaccharide biosynthesis protein
MYKDGVCLKGTFDAGTSNVFAIMKDGSARIMSQNDYANLKSNIQEAVGGKARLLTNGSKPNFSDATYEPRTAVGVTSDYNKVILLVVDGRRSGYSNGANYDMLANIFLAFGAHDAINLDGGGSSTFLIKNTSASKGFETRNKPSSNSEREIANGIAIVKKK